MYFKVRFFCCLIVWRGEIGTARIVIWDWISKSL